MKFKVNPLFFALALALIAFGHALDFVWTMLALLFHESAHALMARARGYVVKKMVLLPYGAMMSAGENFDKTSSVLIGLAGPLCNLLLALVTLGIWWLFPSMYPYTMSFLYANMSLGLFNLLPVYPLDGSRVVLGFCKNKIKAVKGLQIAGIVCSFLFLGLFVGSFFFGLNFTFSIMAVFLFYGATFASKDETYSSVLDVACKNYSLGVELKRVEISCDTPILRLFHYVGRQSKTTFDVVGEGGKIIRTLSEQDLKAIAVKNKLTVAVGQALKGIEKES